MNKKSILDFIFIVIVITSFIILNVFLYTTEQCEVKEINKTQKEVNFVKTKCPDCVCPEYEQKDCVSECIRLFNDVETLQEVYEEK